jgi:hypothetical protein
MVWGALKSGDQNATKNGMSASSINPLSNGYLQSMLGSVVHNAGLTANNANNSLSGIGSLSAVQQPDSGQLSPFAQLMSILQQLQQSNPTQYQQVTQQIATNLQSAAQTAQSEGNTTAATQLNQLSTDFTNASTSGQLPNVQDLAQAVGGHHHHHHAHAASNDSDANSSASSASSNSANQMLSQILSAFQANEAQTNALNPLNIIVNTLSQAGLTVSNG